MKHRILLPLLFLGLLASACSSTQVVSRWKSPDYKQVKPKKTLIVGIARNPTNRRIFEDHFAKELSKHGPEAIASYTLLPEDGELDRPKVEAVVAEHGFDTVLTERIIKVDREIEATSERGVSSMPYPYYGGFYTYYGTAWSRVRTSTKVTEKEVYTLETNLYEAKEGKLVWSARTETFSPESVEKAVDELSDVLIKALAEDRFITKSAQ